MYCSDLTFIDDGNPDEIAGLVNFYKRKLMSKIVIQLEVYQQVPYNLTVVPEIQEWIKTLESKDDDSVLYNISLEIEPRDAKKTDIL